jgi:hypothetical protein
MNADKLAQFKKCDTLEQMFQVLEKNYVLNKKLGLLQKGAILTGMDKLIQVAQLEEKK